MKAIPHLLACCALVLGTFSGGWLQRRMSSNWRSADPLRLAGEQLKQPLPDRIGAWRLMGEPEFADEIVQMLRCPAYVCRLYTHDQTGDTVSVAVLVGPPGPMSVHTPEICYSGQNYQVTEPRVSKKIDDARGEQHALWEVKLEADAVNRVPLRALYGWGIGGRWLATENPRFRFAGVPYLYKIQLASTAAAATDEYDPCQDFLRVFLPELRHNLIPQDDSERGSSKSSPLQPGAI